MVLALLLFAVAAVWFVCKVTIYALPCLVALLVARWAYETGAGWAGGFAVWTLSALIKFGSLRWLYASTAQAWVRVSLAFVFAAPACVMAYFVLDDLSVGQVPSEVWRHALCGLGAGLAGLAAIVRLSEQDDLNGT